MNATEAKTVLDKVFGSIFGFENPFTLDEAFQKFAFDLHLPQQVFDATTGESTWASSINPSRFITMDNARKRSDKDDFMIQKRDLTGIEDVLLAWSETNLTTTERHIDGINVGESDNTTGCENVYRSSDVRNCKNVIFTESGNDLEYIVAGSRSKTSNYCIRVEDSQLCSNSFNVIWSAKVTNSFFIQDCYDVIDCMFCSHISGKRFCIANIQFTEEEYNRLKRIVIDWVIHS